MVETTKPGEDESSSISYYRNIDNELRKGFPTDEDKELFLSNVFDELTKDLPLAATHITTSFVVQKLVELASQDQLHRVLETVLKNFESLIVDRYANFVLETILYKTTHFFDDGDDNSIMDMVYRFGMMLLERTDLLSNSNASFSFRVLVEVMSGIKVSDKKPWKPRKRRLLAGEMKEHDFYNKFSKLLHAFSSYVLPMSSSSIGAVDDVATSVLAQQLLYIFREKEPKHCAQLCQAITDGGLLNLQDSEGVPSVFLSHGGACFCQMLLGGMAKVPLGRLIKQFIVPHFERLAIHSSANYVVQAAISNIKSDKQFNALSKCLKGKLFHWLSPDVNRAGIVSKFCESAANEPSRQTTILQTWKDEMGQSNTNFIVALCMGNPEHNFTSDELSKEVAQLPTLYSVVLQAMFRYKDTSYLCSCLDKLPLKVKYALAQSSAGSFIIDAMFESSSVPSTTKTGFITSLKSMFVQLIMNKSGSKVFDQFWKLMSVPMQTEVIGILAASVSAIMGTVYGKCVAANIHLQDYIHNRAEWDKWIVEENKARKLKKAASKPTRAERRKKKKSSEVSVEGAHEQTIPKEKKIELKVEKATKNASQAEEMAAQESQTVKMAATPKVNKKPTKRKSQTAPEDVSKSAKVMKKSVKSAKNVAMPTEAVSASTESPSVKKSVKSLKSAKAASGQKIAKKVPKSLNKTKG